MNNKLYNDIIKGISNAIYKSLHLNEMARSSVNRTIDKKLWLTVSSTCSRNKSTEAEFVKPSGNDKENLILRYVAALLIMKKPCPNSIEEINDLKTFKLYGKRIIELGGTIDEILDLYNKNNGSNVNKNNQLLSKKEINNNSFDSDINTKLSNNTEETISKKSGGLFSDFDDDFFDDDDCVVSDMLAKNAKLDTDMSLQAVLADLLETNKPRGFISYNPNKKVSDKTPYTIIEKEKYECFYRVDTRPNYWNNKYIRDFTILAELKNWKLYSIDINNLLLKINFEFMTDDEIINTISDYYQIKFLCDKYSRQRDVDIYYLTYLQWKKERDNYINSILDNYIKELFKNDMTLYRVYVSPDNGLIYKISHSRSKPDITSSSEYWTYVLTFTGNVNYKYLMRNNLDNKDKINKVKIDNKKKRVFLLLISKYCGLSNFNWINYIDYNGYPYAILLYNKSGFDSTYKMFTKNYSRYKGGLRYLYIDKPNKTTGSEFDIILNKECYSGCEYILLTGYKDNYHTYSADKDYYIKMYLTNDGKKAFDDLFNKK